MMKYREKFHLSYKEFLATPMDVIYTDLEMLDMEAEIENEHIKSATNKK